MGSVASLQSSLSAAGYDAGGIDGQFGPKTLTALMRYCVGRRDDRVIPVWAAAIMPELKLAGITADRPLRVIHFLGQVAKETGGFTALVENMNYKNPSILDNTFSKITGIEHAKLLIKAGPVAIGNCVYADRNGNGDEASGDGFRYRGRGFLMNTGKTNYREVERYSKLPVLAQPELLGQPGPAAIAAVCYWSLRQINVPADQDDVGMVTQLVNGKARHGLNERSAYVNRLKKIWGL